MTFDFTGRAILASARAAATGSAVLIPARFGRNGSKVHLAAGVIDERRGRQFGRLTTSTPACGAYTRPGSGWALELDTEITCANCAGDSHPMTTEPARTSVAGAIPNGTSVTFTWDGATLGGFVVDSIRFCGQIRHGVRAADGRLYDTWPHHNPQPSA